MKILVEVDAERASAEFKRIRRDANRIAGEAVKTAAEKVALPDAKRNAPGFIRTKLIVRRRGQDAVLTTSLRGKQARVVGLLEFGGTVRTVIRAKQGSAILTPYGPRAAVKNPRTYKGKRFMTDAVAKNRRELDEVILEETVKAFDAFEKTYG